MPTTLETVMSIAENARRHVSKQVRPHLAQEYRDTGRDDDLLSLTFRLTKKARMRAEGRVTPEYKARHPTSIH
jgi:hypothetical protein